MSQFLLLACFLQIRGQLNTKERKQQEAAPSNQESHVQFVYFTRFFYLFQIFLVPSYCSLFIHDDFLTMTFFYPFDHVMQKEFDVYYNTSVKPPIVSAHFSREIHMPKAVLISFRWIKALFISHKNNKRIKKHQYKRDFTQLFFVAHKWSITNEKKNKIL